MLIDGFGRMIDYLRISVTKNCNFRCKYCMPNTPYELYEDLIPLESMLGFLKVAIDLGIKKIRITGGEPLLRKDLSEFIKGIYDYNKNIEIVLTTNGFLLHKYARAFKEAGLRRINVSLDSLKAERVRFISKTDGLETILKGLDEAKSVGLGVKLNMVPLKGVNDDEILTLLDFARENKFLLRYIEYMENSFAHSEIRGLRSDEILNIIKAKYLFKRLQKDNLGPAKIYELEDSSVFGIIAPHNDDFCVSCNRIRLTAEGVLCPCLYFQDSINAREAIESGDKEAMRQILIQAVTNKPEKNKWQNNEHSSRAFYQTGG